MSAVFLETSACLRALFEEPGGDLVNARLREAELIVASRLLAVEAERALLRHTLDDPAFFRVVPEVERELRELWPRVNFFEISREICARASRIAPLTRLRTLDAIHLATFHEARRLDPRIELLTFDERLLAAV